MRRSKRFLLYGSVAALLVVTVPRALRLYLRRLTTALLTLCVLSTPVLARQSSVFGPQAPAPRAAMPGRAPDEARQIAATLSACETMAAELETRIEEAAVLRRAVDLLTRSAAAFEAAAKAERERADNERRRADNNDALRATAEENYKDAVRKGKAGKIKTAILWFFVGAAVGGAVGSGE